MRIRAALGALRVFYVYFLFSSILLLLLLLLLVEDHHWVIDMHSVLRISYISLFFIGLILLDASTYGCCGLLLFSTLCLFFLLLLLCLFFHSYLFLFQSRALHFSLCWYFAQNLLRLFQLNTIAYIRAKNNKVLFCYSVLVCYSFIFIFFFSTIF